MTERKKKERKKETKPWLRFCENFTMFCAVQLKPAFFLIACFCFCLFVFISERYQSISFQIFSYASTTAVFSSFRYSCVMPSSFSSISRQFSFIVVCWCIVCLLLEKSVCPEHLRVTSALYLAFYVFDLVNFCGLNAQVGFYSLFLFVGTEKAISTKHTRFSSFLLVCVIQP